MSCDACNNFGLVLLNEFWCLKKCQVFEEVVPVYHDRADDCMSSFDTLKFVIKLKLSQAQERFGSFCVEIGVGM